MDETINRGPQTIFHGKLVTRTYCGEAGDHAAPNVLSQRDLGLRPDLWTKTDTRVCFCRLSLSANERAMFPEFKSQGIPGFTKIDIMIKKMIKWVAFTNFFQNQSTNCPVNGPDHLGVII